MIAIKHRDTGAVIRAVNVDSLSGAGLSGANLRKAYLAGADLSETNLCKADLGVADLTGANLRKARLRRANLAKADLTWADLSGADLRGAILTRASLSRADFRGSNLAEADLTEIRADVFDIISLAQNEIAGLRLAVVKGRINGSSYSGPCACLVGTIAILQSRSFRCVPGIPIDAARPAERFFMGIGEGNTPETNPVSAIVLGWIDEFTALPTVQ